MLKKQAGFWGALFGVSKRYSMEDLHYLYGVLVRNPVVNEGNRAQVVETIRSIAELMIWGDQNEPRVFEFFLENNVMVYLHKVLLQPGNRRGDVAKQVLQTLSIIIQNVRSETATFFLFSNNHINNIVQIEFDFEDEEVLGYYISFLKTISLKLTKRTVQFFFDIQPDSNKFPLYTEAIKFAHHKEGMVRAAVRTLTLNVYCVKDNSIEEFVTSAESTRYFAHIAAYLAEQIQELDRRMLHVEAGHNVNTISALDSQLAEVEDVISYCSDVLANGPERVAQMLAEQLWTTLAGPYLLWPIMDHIPLATSFPDEQTSSPLKASPGPANHLQPDGSGVFAQGSPARPPASAVNSSASTPTQRRAAVRAACSVCVLERLFQVLAYPPLLQHLAIMLLASVPSPAGGGGGSSGGGGGSPADGGAAAALLPSCRHKLLEVMAAADVRCASGVLRMLVALLQNRAVSTELLYLLGLLPSSPLGLGLHTHGGMAAASSCRMCIWHSWLERLTARLKPDLQDGGVPFAEMLEDLALLASELDAAGPGPLDPRSGHATMSTPHMDMHTNLTPSDMSVDGSSQYEKGVSLREIASGVSEASEAWEGDYPMAGMAPDGLDKGTDDPAERPSSSGSSKATAVQQQQQQAGEVASSDAPILDAGRPMSDASHDEGVGSRGQPQAAHATTTNSQHAADVGPQGAKAAAAAEQTAEEREASDASTADAVVDDLLARLSSVASVEGAKTSSTAGTNAMEGHGPQVVVSGVDDSAGRQGAAGALPETDTAHSLSGAAEDEPRREGLSQGGEEASTSGRSAANAAGTELASALLKMLVLQLVPSSTLCHIGWLLHQLLPSGDQAGACQLSSPQASLLAVAQGQAQTAMLEELGRMWCEAIFPLICLEWPVSRQTMTRPLLRASCDALLTGPQAYPLIQPQSSAGGKQEPVLSGSAQAALRTYHATQRLVALVQMGQLLRSGVIQPTPPTPVINDAELRANDIQEGFQLDLTPGTAISAIVSFAPGQERRVSFAVAGVAGRRRTSDPGLDPTPTSPEELLHSPPVVVLAEPSSTKQHSGVVLSVAPLMGATPNTDPKMGAWLHVHVRPSVRGLLRVLKAAALKKGGLLGAVKQLADGHWVLAFPDAERGRNAQVLVEQHASRLRAIYCNLLSPVLATELPE